jgi:hypothetical protein
MKALPSLLLCFLLTAALPGFAQEKTTEKTSHKTTPKPAEKPADSAPAEEAAPAPAPGGDEPAQIAAAFFGLLEKSKVEDAYTNLTKGSKIAERPEELKALKSKTTEAIQMFGIIQGYDLVETKSVGTHLIRRTYLSLGKEFPLRWRFYFYLSTGRWRLVDLRVDDRLTGTFDEPEEPKTDLAAPK